MENKCLTCGNQIECPVAFYCPKNNYCDWRAPTQFTPPYTPPYALTQQRTIDIEGMNHINIIKESSKEEWMKYGEWKEKLQTKEIVNKMLEDNKSFMAGLTTDNDYTEGYAEALEEVLREINKEDK